MDASDITLDRTCCCDRFIDKYCESIHRLLYMVYNNLLQYYHRGWKLSYIITRVLQRMYTYINVLVVDD